MSEEEEKAIENYKLFEDAIKKTISKGDKELYIDGLGEALKDTVVILNLIEKQQKEIENSVSKDKIRELIEECKKEGCCSDELKEYYDNKCVTICRFYEVCTLLRNLTERK